MNRYSTTASSTLTSELTRKNASVILRRSRNRRDPIRPRLNPLAPEQARR
jgi:hypothetical protein